MAAGVVVSTTACRKKPQKKVNFVTMRARRFLLAKRKDVQEISF